MAVRKLSDLWSFETIAYYLGYDTGCRISRAHNESKNAPHEGWCMEDVNIGDFPGKQRERPWLARRSKESMASEALAAECQIVNTYAPGPGPPACNGHPMLCSRSSCSFHAAIWSLGFLPPLVLRPIDSLTQVMGKMTAKPPATQHPFGLLPSHRVSDTSEDGQEIEDIRYL